MPKQGKKSKKRSRTKISRASRAASRANTEENSPNRNPGKPSETTTPQPQPKLTPEAVEEHYETLLDEIQRLVDSRGSITLASISKTLDLEKGILESWAKILDKSGILELYYPIMGEPLLRKRGYVEQKDKISSKPKSDKSEEQIKAAAPNLPEPQKRFSDKKIKIITIILVIFIVLMFAAVVWLAMKAGYIKLG
jgi:hypothetical protein